MHGHLNVRYPIYNIQGQSLSYNQFLMKVLNMTLSIFLEIEKREP